MRVHIEFEVADERLDDILNAIGVRNPPSAGDGTQLATVGVSGRDYPPAMIADAYRRATRSQRRMLDEMVARSPDWITGADLADAMGGTIDQLNGWLGSFARTWLNVTGGTDPKTNRWFFDAEPDRDGLGWRYRMGADQAAVIRSAQSDDSN